MAEDREALKQKLRSEAPELAAFVDSCRRVFGEIKITYLKIGEVEFGEKSKSIPVRPTDTTPVSQLQNEWYERIGRRAAGGRARK